MPAQREVEAADFIEGFVVDLNILGVEVEELRFELGQRAERVHVLQDEVRRVVVEAEVRRVDVAERTTQMAGVVRRFLPPGHSSRVKDMGQFSMAIFTP